MEETIVSKKRMLSGIKPSGDLTLGSYLGAIKNWKERADEFECYYFMADLHAITVRQNPADLRRRTMEQLAQYIACGLDPEKNTLFIQSRQYQRRPFHLSQFDGGGYFAVSAGLRAGGRRSKAACGADAYHCPAV